MQGLKKVLSVVNDAIQSNKPLVIGKSAEQATVAAINEDSMID
jgi:hypothetical protein